MPLLTAVELARRSGASLNQVQYLTHLRLLVPAVPAKRRGMEKFFAESDVAVVRRVLEVIEKRKMTSLKKLQRDDLKGGPMEFKELRQAAIDCLARAFKGDSGIPVHVVQAASSIVLTPPPEPRKSLQ